LKGTSTIGWICESIQFSYNGGSGWYNYITGDPSQVAIVMTFKERTKSHKGEATQTDWSDLKPDDITSKAADGAIQKPSPTSGGSGGDPWDSENNWTQKF
jgi:hypothetical protein